MGKENSNRDKGFGKGQSYLYETNSDIELNLVLYCINRKCKNKTKVRLIKKGSSTGAYHNKKYGVFDTRNEGFVCKKCQNIYDLFFRGKGWHRIYGILPLNRAMI